MVRPHGIPAAHRSIPHMLAAMARACLQRGGAEWVGEAPEQGPPALGREDGSDELGRSAAARPRLLLPDAYRVQRLPRHHAAGAANAACIGRQPMKRHEKRMARTLGEQGRVPHAGRGGCHLLESPPVKETGPSGLP